MKMGKIKLLTLFAICGWGLFSCSNPEKGPVIEIGIETATPVCKASIRGLCLVNDNVGWASGSGGTFLRMTDGAHWVADTVAGYAHLDFRDVHGFDANTALLMAAGEEGRILRTEDGGVSWTEVYTRLDSGIFLDGMDFYGMTGYCYGDPIDGKFVVIRSKDSGKTWTEVPPDQLPDALPHEAGFAASGTGIIVNQNGVWFGTGGDSVTRIFSLFYKDGFNWSTHDTRIRSGDGCGIFSMTFRTPTNMMVVGGSYADSTNADGNFETLDYSNFDSFEKMHVIFSTRIVTLNPPRGYRSCIAKSQKSNLLVACGRTGIDYSLDDGVNWLPLSDDGYFTCALAQNSGWLMGRGGKMAKVSW